MRTSKSVSLSMALAPTQTVVQADKLLCNESVPNSHRALARLSDVWGNLRHVGAGKITARHSAALHGGTFAEGPLLEDDYRLAAFSVGWQVAHPPTPAQPRATAASWPPCPSLRSPFTARGRVSGSACATFLPALALRNEALDYSPLAGVQQPILYMGVSTAVQLRGEISLASLLRFRCWRRGATAPRHRHNPQPGMIALL